MKSQAILLVLVSSLLTACGGSGGSTTVASDTCADLSGNGFDCQSMLQDIKAASLAKVTALDIALIDLSEDVDAYCADTTNSGLQVTAQTTFKATMAITQQLEVMQFGPTAEVRDDFYAWPANSLCRIDDQIATAANADFSVIDQNARGLTAVEYLLFEDDVAVQCQDVLSVPTWLQATPNAADRKIARCDYAKRIVDDLEIRASDLKSSLIGYDFTSDFVTLQQAANAISDALFYVDTQTKDAKIKEPLNVTSSVDVAFNTAQLESQFANISKENIINNLEGTKIIIQAGIDDYLIAKGQQTLASNMVTAIDGALANLADIDGNLNAALTSGTTSSDQCTNLGTSGSYDVNVDLEALCALQWNIKTFTDLLKQDFVLALSFSTPATADGDND